MNGKQREAIDCLAKVLDPLTHQGQLDMSRKLALALEESTSLAIGLERLFNHGNYLRIKDQLDKALADYQVYVGKRLAALRKDA